MTLYEAHAMLRVNLFCVMEISTEPDVQVITISQKPVAARKPSGVLDTIRE